MPIQRHSKKIEKKEEEEEEEQGVCCGKKMSNNGDDYLCRLCGRCVRILEHMTEEPKSQGIKFYDNGRKVYGSGDSVEKTEAEKIKNLQDEFIFKISQGKQGAIIDNTISYPVACLAYSVFKISNKKTENRDQVFGCCWKKVAESMGETIHPKEIKKTLNLKKTGVGNGRSFLSKVFIEKTKNDPDTNLGEIFGYRDIHFGGKFHQIHINVDMVSVLVSKQLSMLDEHSTNRTKFNTKRNRQFCTGLIQFMRSNSICYDVVTKTMCGGVIYYMLEKFYKSFLYKLDKNGKKKKLIPKNVIENIIMVQQNSLTGVYSTLNLEVVQEILPREYKSNQTIIPSIVNKECVAYHDLCETLLKYVESNAMCPNIDLVERCRCCNDYITEMKCDTNPPESKMLDVIKRDDVQKGLPNELISIKYIESVFNQIRKGKSIKRCVEVWKSNLDIKSPVRQKCEAIECLVCFEEGEPKKQLKDNSERIYKLLTK